MQMVQKSLVLAVALCGLSAVAQAQTSGTTNPSQTTTTQEAQRGVPGVDVDVNRSGRDRGVPGVDVSVGADGDQRNVDTRRSGAGAAATRTTRTARADRN